MRKISIGADIGGSHITTMAVDLETGQIMKETHARCDVDSNGTADHILSAWKSSLAATIARSGNHQVTGIGFAMPGPFNYPGGIAMFSGVGKFDALYGRNIRQEVKAIPGLPENLPVRFLNDATCFAMGEAWLGKASMYDRVVAITLGTGFGSAFLDHGVPVTTGNEVPGEGWVYHLPYGNSIADDYFSTRWFIKRYREITGTTLPGVREIASLYQESSASRLIFNEFGLNLGEFLAPLLIRFNAKCLVIGGSISLSYDLFQESFLSGLSMNVASRMHSYATIMGEDAAIAGSARLSDNAFYQNIELSHPKEVN